MIVSHIGHSIETFARAIPNSHNWAASVLVSWDAEGQRKVHEFHGPVDGRGHPMSNERPDSSQKKWSGRKTGRSLSAKK